MTPSTPDSQGQSRLDKLFSLLQGPQSSPGVRRIAAKQIASIVEVRHEDGPVILSRLVPILLATNGDARTAAAFGLEMIAKALKIEPFVPVESLQFSSFSLSRLLDELPPLLSSTGTEFELDPNVTAKQQKRNLRQLFSIARGVEFDELTDVLVREEDLSLDSPSRPMSDSDTSQMSARERAMAKRKAKMATNGPTAKRAACSATIRFALSDSESEPLGKSLSYFIEHLYSPIWTLRHGAVLGIESIIAGQGAIINSAMRETLAFHLIALLALDRFADYIGDHIVSPVRDAAATVLGQLVTIDILEHVIQSLVQLVSNRDLWQIRHGGLLGLSKIDIACKPALTVEIVKYAPVLLGDEDDDVRNLTARLLIKLLPVLSNSIEHLDLERIFQSTIALIENADDLTASIAGALQLLVSLTSLGFSDARILSLLLPFYRSPLSSVRLAVLNTLKSMRRLNEESSIQLLQMVLLEAEESDEVPLLALDLLSRHQPDQASRFLPCIFSRIGTPYDPEVFEFYAFGSSEPLHIPPAHELSFRQADMMLIPPRIATRQRLWAGKALTKLFSFDDLLSYYPSDLFYPLLCALRPPGVLLHDDFRTKLESSTRDSLLYLIYFDSGDIDDIIELTGHYLCDCEDVDVIIEMVVEGLSGKFASHPKTLATLPMGQCLPDSPFIRLLRHCQLTSELSSEFIEESPDQLLALYCLLNASTCQVEPAKTFTIVKEALHNGNYSLPNAFTAFFRRDTSSAISLLIDDFIPFLAKANDNQRLLVVKSISLIVTENEESVVPFAPLLLIPILARMADSNADVSAVASPLFAHLVRLAPLEENTKLPEGLEKYSTLLTEARSFIAALADPASLQSSIPSPPSVKASLRPYQQTGYAWLVFLQRFGLHGALCDDMGLGKTLQTLSCLSYYHFTSKSPRTSLVICPSSLIGHWAQEVQRYVPHLSCLVFSGKPPERRERLSASTANIIISAYDTFRNDIDAFRDKEYGYLILDEAHIVRNPKTRLWLAVKEVRATHRLVLTGTPIQNDVSELWALFDILMPGYLGDSSSFGSEYARPIQAAGQSTAAAKDFTIAQNRLKRLHKQVLPFVLRRLKEDVLTELPPKIIQDYECDLGAVQSMLYEHLRKSASESDSLRLMTAFRRICVHPAMALSADGMFPDDLLMRAKSLMAKCAEPIMHSPKLIGLKDILISCGIGGTEDPSGTMTANHRVLIFVQQKAALDIIQDIVLKPLFPSSSFLRLDGDIPAADRQAIVDRFNRDPSIDGLLLTTRVGGLGLNLTGADTVVFVEHDWNPQADLQAMDRAHRLGQTRTVTVYRLMTRDTIEERIMGLQAWKKRVAGTVINQQNAVMESMDTAGLLDLLASTADSAGHVEKDEEPVDIEKIIKAL